MEPLSSHPAVLGRLWRLALPIILAGQLALLTDGITLFWLGRLLGPGAMAVETTLRPFLLVTAWIFLAPATGASVLVARSVGAKDGRGLTIIASTLVLAAVMWAALTAIVLPLSGLVCELLASKQATPDDLLRFFRPWLLLALPGVALIQVLLMAANAAGWPRLAVARITGELIVLAFLIPVMVDALGLGLAGAPVAQAVPTFAFGVLIWLALYRQRERRELGARVDRAALLDRRLWWQSIDVGLPLQIARIATFLAQTALVQVLAPLGKEVVAGYGIAILILMLGGNVTSSLSQAGGILMGQRLGSDDRAGARQVLRATLASSVAIGALLAAALSLAAPWIAAAFTDKQAVLEQAIRATRMFMWSLLGVCVWQTMLAAFGAIKASKRAGLVSAVAEACGVALAIAWPLESKLVGVAVALAVSHGLRALLLLALARWVVAPQLAPRAAEAA